MEVPSYSPFDVLAYSAKALYLDELADGDVSPVPVEWGALEP